MSLDLPGLDLEPLGEPSFAALTFDARAFMQYVDSEGLTDTQAEQLLAAMWEIVVAFVDLRFGISPLQGVVDGFGGDGTSSPQGDDGLLSSLPFISDHKRNKAGRESVATAGSEDS